MAPPPTTATDAGSASRARTSSEVITTVPSTSNPGMVRGTDPAASTMSVAGHLGGGPVVAGDADPVAAEQRAAAVEHGHAPSLQQAGQPVEQLVDDLLLALLADRELDRRARSGRRPAHDPELGGRAHRAVDGGRLQELLGRHAAPVEAGAAHLVQLDQRHRQPGGGAVEGGGVPARPPADDDHVEACPIPPVLRLLPPLRSAPLPPRVPWEPPPSGCRRRGPFGRSSASDRPVSPEPTGRPPRSRHLGPADGVGCGAGQPPTGSGRRPTADTSGAVVTSSRPAARLARCRSMLVRRWRSPAATSPVADLLDGGPLEDGADRARHREAGVRRHVRPARPPAAAGAGSARRPGRPPSGQQRRGTRRGSGWPAPGPVRTRRYRPGAGEPGSASSSTSHPPGRSAPTRRPQDLGPAGQVDEDQPGVDQVEGPGGRRVGDDVVDGHRHPGRAGVPEPGQVDVGGQDRAAGPDRSGPATPLTVGPPAPTSQHRQPGPTPVASRWREGGRVEQLGDGGQAGGRASSSRLSSRYPHRRRCSAGPSPNGPGPRLRTAPAGGSSGARCPGRGPGTPPGPGRSRTAACGARR